MSANIELSALKENNGRHLFYDKKNQNPNEVRIFMYWVTELPVDLFILLTYFTWARISSVLFKELVSGAVPPPCPSFIPFSVL